jgi:AcrR family transcriptional regulator
MTERRRVEILGATATAIAERGLCETRIADVAEIVGVSPALILYYFPSKAALLTEALVYLDQRFHENISEKLGVALTAEERLIIVIDESCPRQAGPGELPDSWDLWPAAWEMSRLDPDLAAARSRLDEAWRARIVTIVEDGMSTGEFRSVDAKEFAMQLTAMLDGLAMEAIVGDPTVDADRMSELARSFARSALLGS